jgi:hypothetical protein
MIIELKKVKIAAAAVECEGVNGLLMLQFAGFV